MKLLCYFLVSLTALAITSSAQGADKPNVLFIAVDDLNHWVGYLGRNPQTKTPNIDRLAGRGVRFTRSYCAAPVCNPSRAALMSGLRPSTSGVYNNNNDWRKVISEDLPLTAAFRRAGWRSDRLGTELIRLARQRWGDRWGTVRSGLPARRGSRSSSSRATSARGPSTRVSMLRASRSASAGRPADRAPGSSNARPQVLAFPSGRS